MTRTHVLGVPIDALDLDVAVARVLGWLDAPASNTAHFCNVHLVVSGTDDPTVARALASGTLNATDGMPLVWIARRAEPRATRVSGPDLMLAVMDRGRARGARHYLYGGGPGVADRLASRLAMSLPGVSIVGTCSPPYGLWSDEELERDVARIASTSPDFVWVGLGAPKQELWVEQARSRVRVAGLLAVGAAFDFHSGQKRRAPMWMQRSGLEWLFRLATEPRRLWRRYLVTNTRFVLMLARESVRARQ